MAQNFIQPGEVVTVAAPRNLSSGELVVVGLLAGVAQFDALSGAPVEIATEGVFTLAKTSAQAWATVGLPIYVIPASGLVTTATTTGNVLVGVNLETALNPSGTGTVRLNGVAPAAAA
jgi:predicted RecA/RadA family phage recombinase